MLTAYRRYFDFKGRSNRKEYWLFLLAVVLQAIVAAMVDFALFNGAENMKTYEISGPALVLVLLANLIPSFALTVRRLHDFSMTGWLTLISLIPMVGNATTVAFGVIPGTPGSNRFGPAPGATLQDLQETFA